jgi:hypothetical protein
MLPASTRENVVLPDRIKLSTSPFITLMLSHPPTGVCVLDHPFTVVPKDLRCRPSGLYTFPKLIGLGSGLPSDFLDGFPEFERCASDGGTVDE